MVFSVPIYPQALEEALNFQAPGPSPAAFNTPNEPGLIIRHQEVMTQNELLKQQVWNPSVKLELVLVWAHLLTPKLFSGQISSIKNSLVQVDVYYRTVVPLIWRDTLRSRGDELLGPPGGGINC